jgi:hypothetical protein
MGKKRIAKHVQEAQENQRKEAALASPDGADVQQPVKKKRRKKKKKKVKDPKEAHSYLALWQQQQKLNNNDDANKETVALWRFNKNTQSWLIRHMYDADKVPKATFSILTAYLEGLKGSSKQRLDEDSVRRALRYKHWEKNKDAKKSKDEDDEEDKDTNENEEEDESDDEEEDQEKDQKRWKGLSDRDKRVEYKRARQIIDLLKRQKTAEIET